MRPSRGAYCRFLVDDRGGPRSFGGGSSCTPRRLNWRPELRGQGVPGLISDPVASRGCRGRSLG